MNQAMWDKSEAQTGIKDISFELYEAFTSEKAFGTGCTTSRYALYDGFLTGSQGGQPVAPLMGKFKGYDGD